MLSFVVDETISKVLPSITRATVPTISAAIAVIGWLLRARRERPRSCSAAEQRDEIAAP